MKKTGMLKRCLVLLLCFCMIASNFTFASAEAEYESADTEYVVSADGTCPHHTEHNEECGYKAAAEGSPCNKDCTDADGDGVIDHVSDCTYNAAEAGSPCNNKCEICTPYAENKIDTQSIGSDDNADGADNGGNAGSDTDNNSGNAIMLTSLVGAGDSIVMPASVDNEPAAQSDGEGKDFSNEIKTVTVLKNSGTSWVEGETSADGHKVFEEFDTLQLTIDYELPANYFGDSTNHVIYYQLPDGIEVSGASGSITKSGEQTFYGNYTITDTGLITLIFNENYKPNEAFKGYVQFQSKATSIGEYAEKRIEFPNNNIIIIKKLYDIKAEKSAAIDMAGRKIYYTVKISSEHGTEGTVTIQDKKTTQFMSANYDKASVKVKKFSSDGSSADISCTAEFSSDGSGFEITGLDKLAAGDYYELTYAMDFDYPQGNYAASQCVSNTVTAESAGKTSSVKETKFVYTGKVIEKTGTYDETNKTITWTVTINQDNMDIAGWILEDTISTAGLTPSDIQLKNLNTGVTESITLPYMFQEDESGHNLNKYELTCKTLVDGDFSGDVTNTATLKKDEHSYNDSSTVRIGGIEWGIDKELVSKEDPDSSRRIGSYTWNSTVTVQSGGVSSIRLVDKFQESTYSNKHYAIASELDEALKSGLSLTLNDGTVIKYDNDSYTFNIVYYSNYSTVNPVASPEEKVDSFIITVKRNSGNITDVKSLSTGDYTTHVDFSDIAPGATWTITNYVEEENSREYKYASTTYTEPEQALVKTASAKESTSYSINPNIKIQQNDDGTWGTDIYYQLLWKNFNESGKNENDTVVLTDTLPKGIVFDKLTGAYFKYTNQFGGGTSDGSLKSLVTVNTGTDEAGNTTVTFTITGGYYKEYDSDNLYDLQIFFKAHVQDEAVWGNLKNSVASYTNTATATENGQPAGSATQTTTVTRTLPGASKSAEQLTDAEGNPISRMTYKIVVNPSAEQLNNGNTLTLIDRLQLSYKDGNSNKDATNSSADLYSLKLYALEGLGANSEPILGEEIDTSRYSYTVTPNYTQNNKLYASYLTVELEDELACVLVYSYDIDVSAYNELSAYNSAQLTGASSTYTQTAVKTSSSEAGGYQGSLTIYKADSQNYSKLLPGAKFKLEKYVDGAWMAETMPTNGGAVPEAGGIYTVGESGSLVFNTLKDGATSLSSDTLYRLTETVAPAGYAFDETPHYFVIIGTLSKANTIQNMTAAGVSFGTGDIPAADSVKFVSEKVAATIYVPNTSTELTVKKVWVGSDGKTMTSTPEAVTVALYQSSKPVGDPVTLNAANDWSYTWEGLTGSGYSVKELSVTSGGETYTVGSDGTVTAGSETYTVSYRQNTSTSGGAFTGEITITNRKQPGKTTISGTKTWVDGDNWNNSRPESIKVNLLANGEVSQTLKVTPDESGEWKYSFADLPEEDDNGAKITYKITEDAVEGYTASYSGYNITNTYNTPKPVSLSIPVKKTISGDTPDTAETFTFTLTGADGSSDTATITGAGSAKFGEIRYTEAGTYTYTVTETKGSAEGYVYDDSTHTVVVTVTENTADNTLSASWTVDGTASGTVTFTNTYTKPQPKTVDISVTKTWNDADNQDGKRPASITVKLMAVKTAGGTAEEVQSATISPDESGNWAYTFTGLDKFNGEFEIQYSVEEVSVNEYTSKISGSATDGFTITNSHTPATKDIEVTKTWVDGDNWDYKRPREITVTLVKNGTATDNTVKLSAEDSWAAKKFESLPVYENGVEINWTVTEETVNGYTATYSGYNITNTYNTPKPVTLTIPVEKKISGDTPETQETFTFTIAAVTSGAPVPDNNSVTIAGKGKGSFGEIKYTQTGTYTYTLTEADNGTAGYTYAGEKPSPSRWSRTMTIL